MSKYLLTGDKIIIIISILLSVMMFFAFPFWNKKESNIAEVYSNGELIKSIDMNINSEYKY